MVSATLPSDQRSDQREREKTVGNGCCSHASIMMLTCGWVSAMAAAIVLAAWKFPPPVELAAIMKGTSVGHCRHDVKTSQNSLPCTIARHVRREGSSRLAWMKVEVPSIPLRLITCTAGLALSIALMLLTYASIREALLQHG